MYLSSQQTNEDTPNSFMSRTMEISTSTSRPGPSQLFAAGVSGAAVGGAVVALLISAGCSWSNHSDCGACQETQCTQVNYTY